MRRSPHIASIIRVILARAGSNVSPMRIEASPFVCLKGDEKARIRCHLARAQCLWWYRLQDAGARGALLGERSPLFGVDTPPGSLPTDHRLCGFSPIAGSTLLPDWPGTR